MYVYIHTRTQLSERHWRERERGKESKFKKHCFIQCAALCVATAVPIILHHCRERLLLSRDRISLRQYIILSYSSLYFLRCVEIVLVLISFALHR